MEGAYLVHLPAADHGSTPSTAKIPLYHRDGSVAGYATVDLQDFEHLSQYRWHLKRAWPTSPGYAQRRAGGVQVAMHRQILGLPPRRDGGPEADHVNRNGLDNRRCNLRVVTRSQNNQNRPAQHNAKSPYRGVWWASDKGKWRASVKLDGRRYYGGYFTDEAQAAEAARQLRLHLLPYTVEVSA